MVGSDGDASGVADAGEFSRTASLRLVAVPNATEIANNKPAHAIRACLPVRVKRANKVNVAATRKIAFPMRSPRVRSINCSPCGSSRLARQRLPRRHAGGFDKGF